MKIHPLELLNIMKQLKEKKQSSSKKWLKYATPIQFWVEAINNVSYTANRVFVRPRTKKRPYEL